MKTPFVVVGELEPLSDWKRRFPGWTFVRLYAKPPSNGVYEGEIRAETSDPDEFVMFCAAGGSPDRLAEKDTREGIATDQLGVVKTGVYVLSPNFVELVVRHPSDRTLCSSFSATWKTCSVTSDPFRYW